MFNFKRGCSVVKYKDDKIPKMYLGLTQLFTSC